MKIYYSKLNRLEKIAKEIHRRKLITCLVINSEKEIEQYRDKLAPNATIIINDLETMRKTLEMR